MSVAYRTAGTPVSGAGVTEIDPVVPGGVVAGDLIVAAFGFEGVDADSGPWIDENTGQYPSDYIGPFTGWKRIVYQGPSADGGSGLEVWAALFLSGTDMFAKFFSAQDVVVALACWSGAYSVTGHITDGPVRGGTIAQVSGDDPAAPSVLAFENELLIAAGADQLQSPGWGTPTPPGWTARTDAARAATHGNVETVLADKPVTHEGDSGLIPFPASAIAAGTKGATATLAIRPAPPASTSPLIAVEYAVSS